ncbi:MAG: putative proline rich signal peptide protein [Proteobacteria bacterium]|nr:putative proline rich signal peptide protein [Pseudomonadota bacterium]
MVSSTVCLKNVIERLRRCLLLLIFLPLLASSAEIEMTAPQIVAGEDGYVLSADFTFDLSPRLEEAVTRGVVLYFVADFELSRARWYWLDEKLVSRSQTYRLSYHALTRQYRLSTGALHQSFATLSEALRMLAHLRNWVVVEKNDKSVRPGEPYLAALRLHLDVTQLPRPFQMTALGNKDWSLSSDRKTWPLTLPASLPVEAK